MDLKIDKVKIEVEGIDRDILNILARASMKLVTEPRVGQQEAPPIEFQM